MEESKDKKEGIMKNYDNRSKDFALSRTEDA